MTTPLTTSVTVDFCPRNSSTPSSALTGTLIDNRNYLTLNLSYTDSVAKFVNAQVLIDSIDATSPATLKSYNLKLGQNFIGTSSSVSANDIRHSFTDLSRYSIKIKAVTNDGSVTTLYSQYANDESPSSSYNFLFRSDGGDVFDVDANCNVINSNDIEGAADNVIVIVCPLIAEPAADSRVPSKVLFTFDESDDYVGTANDTDNSEKPSGCSFLVNYEEFGSYNLTQTSDNHLTNDFSYAVSVTAIYDSANGGHTVSKTLDDLVHAIASPVINQVVAYGLGEDQTDADDATISSFMNVYLTPESSPVNILPASGKVTFNLSQDGAVFYSAKMDVSSTTDSDGNYVYTILKSDLTKIWTTTPPVQNANKSYTFDVTAEVVYTILDGSVVKTSNIVPAQFTSDINQLSSVNLVNAWMAATNVAGSGNRTVNISNATTASGYSVAPELGLIVNIPKNDFYGSAITAGMYADLDAVDGDGNPTTHHKFMMSTDGGVTYEPVKKLYQLQGDYTKTIQENCIVLLSLTAGDAIQNDDGLYPNIPGTPSVLGSAQPSIYAWIPNDVNGFSQQDSVKISVAIVPPSGLTTLPAPTESDEVVAVNKINRYEMTVDSVSEPRFTGTGAYSELVVPINNPTTDEFYFSSAIFSSTLSSPNDSVTQAVSNDGVFDITIENPSIRGTTTTCDYTVAYKIDDPNGGTITGPDSILYSIHLKDEPTKDNFTVSNFSYNTFNDDDESSFKFDIVFNNVGNTSIDGVNVYFSSNNDDANNSNDIPETLVLTVERLDGDSQSNLTVTLQSAAPTTSALSDGVKIVDSDGVLSSNTWKNFRSGIIIFKPYYTARVTSSNDAQTEIDDEKTENIMNVPVIDLPANVSLTGGVIDSYDDTKLEWDNDLVVVYYGLSSITASYDLALNGVDQTNNITANDSYIVDLGSTPSSYTLELRTKVSSNVDANVYYSKKVVVEFDSVSVYESGMNVTVTRGSNDVNLNAQFAAYTTLPNPASNLNVTEVKLVDNSTSDANTNPDDAGVKVLTCSNNTTSVQVDATVNSYDLTAVYAYEQAELMNLTVRMEAGIDYTLKYGDSSASNEESTPIYLTLNGPSKPYVVATKPSVEILTRYDVTSGTYTGQTALSMIIDGNGAKNEGVQSVMIILATEGDYTDANNGSGSGAEIILAFESSNARLRSYTVGSNADVTLNSTDNLAASEVHILTTDDTEGFSESTSSGVFTLVMGTLDNSDASTLYMPADCEFTTSPISVVVVVSTRLGTDVDMTQLN